MKTLLLILVLLPAVSNAEKITIYEGSFGTNVPNLLAPRMVIDTDTNQGYRTMPGTNFPDIRRPLAIEEHNGGYTMYSLDEKGPKEEE